MPDAGTLFDIERVKPRQEQDTSGKDALGRYPLHRWASDALVRRYFPHLRPGRDLVIEPGCGNGSFLQAIPSQVTAIGVELDPQLAEDARRITGREIICGDFRTVELPAAVTAIIGNPPFAMETIEEFLIRAYHLLPEGGNCGFLLPSFAVQSYRRVLRWNQSWSLFHESLPKGLYRRISHPLCFVLFTRSSVRTLVGFALYREMGELENLSRAAKLILAEGKPHRSVWRAVVEDALERLGGQGSLTEIYSIIEPRRPTPNSWWRDRVRAVLQRWFVQVDRGIWALNEEAAKKDSLVLA